MESEAPAAANHPTGREWRVDDFAYSLPAAAIAQEPLVDRAASRLLVVRPGRHEVSHSAVGELGRWLRRGDLLVANNSRVLPARLEATREGTGGRVELLLLRSDGGNRWLALAKPARRLRPGSRLIVSPTDAAGPSPLAIEVESVVGDGQLGVRLEGEPEVDLSRYGRVPLPPYITAPLSDGERYQTVFARNEGSAAAPTAGLHFTLALIDELRAGGIGWAEITLHVGLDTFRPVAVDRVADHAIHREWIDVPDETARAVATTQRAGGRIFAVGTTTARTLEFFADRYNAERPVGSAGMADIFIRPGYRWRLVDGLLTNFHLPRSTLLMMVSALAGVETIRAAYAAAIAEGYRFYSFGDAMLILPTEG
ncbi:MAG: tRNA preQ1(34) S-adenosylmethionine ribosyltransferase-isomerase QueA [Chloroflexia bacterium]|nr:tRNA preQ1(34) S-adenosylmethionine ribosyltransferase-isomerase QueA [Chloroflexia bacterium]